jgi:hypothetical protein
MTREQIDRICTSPASRQEDAVLLLLELETQDTTPYRLSPEERADIEAALREVERGEFASEEEVAAVFARYRE